MKSSFIAMVCAVSLLWGSAGVFAAADAIVACGSDDKPDAAASAEAKPLDQAELEKKFAETMSGATLIGTFTVTGQTDQKLNEEKYTIESCKKLKSGKWQFKSRIQYGGKDLTVPLALDVMWAGDTPVITLTDMPVPGFGTFTARVIIFRDEYAGTWSGADHGGHLFGRIERTDKSADDKGAEKTAER